MSTLWLCNLWQGDHLVLDAFLCVRAVHGSGLDVTRADTIGGARRSLNQVVCIHVVTTHIATAVIATVATHVTGHSATATSKKIIALNY